jgi:hypothetical protein
MSQGHNHNESWGHVTPASPSACKTPRLSPYQRQSLSVTRNSRCSRVFPTRRWRHTDRETFPARFSELLMLQSLIRWLKGCVRTLFFSTNRSLMNNAVAPQSTIAATGALRFRPSRKTRILKCEPTGFITGTMLELILLQGSESLPLPEALPTWGDDATAFARARFKNPPQPVSRSELPKPSAPRGVGPG